MHTSSVTDTARAALTRRRLLAATAASSAAAIASMLRPVGAAAADTAVAAGPPPIVRGRIRQSVVSWCFQLFGEKWDLPHTCRVARELGCQSVELLDPEHFATLKQYGLTCAIANNGMPGAPFIKGLNNLSYHEEIIARTTRVIEATAAAGFPAVIAFTGFKYRNAEDPTSGEIPLDEGADNTVAGLKQLARIAEQHNVEVHLEHLNTRVTGHDFKGHPGYQGDDIDYCADIIRRVGSPKVKLLFDLYHVQVMNGDLIARIREYGTDIIGHIHTAGVPGRIELDKSQEINYPAVMQALLEIGYTGYVGQEFIPTRDPLQGLRQAVALCDV